MRLNKLLCLSALFAGCVDEELAPTDEGIEASGEALDDLVESAYCLALTTAPAPHVSVNLDTLPSNGQLFIFDDYGTTSCSMHTVSLKNGGWYNYMTAISRPTDPTTCAATKLTYYEFRKFTATGAWDVSGPYVWEGNWDGTICRLPELSGTPHNVYELRITAKLQRTTCSGMWCGTEYGLPMFAVLQP